MKPAAAYVFGTTWLDAFAIGIRYAQHGKTPFHVGVMFIMEDGQQIGFEARMSDNDWVQFDYNEKAQKYLSEVTRSIREIRLNLSSAETKTLFLEAQKMKRTVKRYPRKWRILWKLMHQRHGWPMRNTVKEEDCSEGVARLLFKVGIDLRDEKNDVFDELSPSEVWDNLKVSQASSDAQEA